MSLLSIQASPELGDQPTGRPWIKDPIPTPAGTLDGVEPMTSTRPAAGPSARAIPLLWLVFLTNALVLAVALLLLAFTPITVHAPIETGQFLLLFAGFVVLLLLNVALLRRVLAPLLRLTDVMSSVDPDRPGRRLSGVEPRSVEGRALAQAFNAMLDRLEQARRDATRTALAAQESERLRVARELHDEIGQLLTSLRFALQSGAGGRAMVDEILDDLFERVRDISSGLRPPMLETLGLGPTLSWHCERFSAQTGVYVNLMTSGLRQRYPSKIELAVFRVVQEALTNVARHAGTTNAQVAVRGGRNYIEALILDRGVGFAPMKLVPHQSSGITGMRERARSAGGRMNIASSPERGTRISLFIPISPRRDPSSNEVP